jgi:hypothetical protein
MRKSLSCLFVVVALAIGAAAQSPTIVAQLTLKDQTASIPRTTLLTPTVDGLYRITAYFNLAKGDALGTRWCLFVYWADDNTQRSAALGAEAAGDSGPSFSSFVIPAQIQAGRPLRYQTGPCPGGTKNDPYSLYITVEQLQ